MAGARLIKRLLVEGEGAGGVGGTQNPYIYNTGEK